jgi:hypothetical protein
LSIRDGSPLWTRRSRRRVPALREEQVASLTKKE